MYFILEGEICATVNYENVEVKRYFSEGFYIGMIMYIIYVKGILIVHFELRAHSEAEPIMNLQKS